jgi:hypothetical protein
MLNARTPLMMGLSCFSAMAGFAANFRRNRPESEPGLSPDDYPGEWRGLFADGMNQTGSKMV